MQAELRLREELEHMAAEQDADTTPICRLSYVLLQHLTIDVWNEMLPRDMMESLASYVGMLLWCAGCDYSEEDEATVRAAAKEERRARRKAKRETQTQGKDTTDDSKTNESAAEPPSRSRSRGSPRMASGYNGFRPRGDDPDGGRRKHSSRSAYVSLV